MNTKKIIKEAAFALFEQKPFEQISVQNIIEAAEVSRRTFYAHYADKYDLMSAYFTDIVERTVFPTHEPPEHISQDEWRKYMIAYFLLMKERRAYYKNKGYERSYQVLWSFIERYTFEYYQQMRLKRTGQEALSKAETLTVKAIVGAYSTVLMTYLDERIGVSAEEAIAVLEKIIPQDYRTY